MSTAYRDPPKWKQNASERLHVEMYTRLQAASTFCERLVGLANTHMQLIEEHVAAGGDPLEGLVGTEFYEKIRAKAQAEVARASRPVAEDLSSREGETSSAASSDSSGDDAPPRESQSVTGHFSCETLAKEEAPSQESAGRPAHSKGAADTGREARATRKYMPRVSTPPLFALAYRAMEMQTQLAPVVRELGESLLAAGIDVRRFQEEDVVAAVFRDQFGFELEEIDQATYEQMCDTLRQSQQWVREFKQKMAELAGEPPPGEAKATDG